MKRYKVHTNYVTGTGKFVPAGVYNENEIDLSEARRRAIVTLDKAVDSVDEKDKDKIPLNKLNFGQSDTSVVDMSPELKVTAPKRVLINSCTAEDLIPYKYVTKKVANKVISGRKNGVYEDYPQLNRRVPMGYGRLWEDYVPVDFTIPEINNMTVHYDIL